MEQATRGTGVSVTQTANNQLKLEIPSDVSFDSGSAQIKPNLRPVLDRCHHPEPEPGDDGADHRPHRQPGQRRDQQSAVGEPRRFDARLPRRSRRASEPDQHRRPWLARTGGRQQYRRRPGAEPARRDFRGRTAALKRTGRVARQRQHKAPERGVWGFVYLPCAAAHTARCRLGASQDVACGRPGRRVEWRSWRGFCRRDRRRDSGACQRRKAQLTASPASKPPEGAADAGERQSRGRHEKGHERGLAGPLFAQRRRQAVADRAEQGNAGDGCRAPAAVRQRRWRRLRRAAP